MALLLLALACQRPAPQASQASQAPAPVEPTSPHELVIERAAIQYNGKPLALLEPIETWFAVLGPPSRDFMPGQRFVVWDDIGIYVRVIDGKAYELGVYLQPRIPPTDPKVRPFLPHSRFTGRLIVDGWRIHKDVNPTEVRHHFAKWRRDNLHGGYTYEYDQSDPPVSGHLDASGNGGSFRFELTLEL